MFCCFPDGPVSLAIEPKKDSYSVGESIKITFDCKPYPDQFKWTDNTTGSELGSGRSLMLTEAMIGKQSLRISVCNTMPNTESVCKEQQFFVTVKRKLTSLESSHHLSIIS